MIDVKAFVPQYLRRQYPGAACRMQRVELHVPMLFIVPRGVAPAVEVVLPSWAELAGHGLNQQARLIANAIDKALAPVADDSWRLHQDYVC